MKRISRKGARNFEECVELTIDFENRRLKLEYYFNHPMGGAGNVETFAFEEAASAKFQNLLEYYGSGGYDETFGTGAESELKRILNMSRGENAASDLEEKEIIIDLTTD